MAKSTNFSEKDISQITTYQSGVAQAAAHRLVNRVVTDFLLTYGLTPMQWFTIGFIYDCGDEGIRPSDLAKALNTTMPYITTTLSTLEARAIITKKTHLQDNRIKLISVVPSYRKTVTEIESGLRIRMRDELYAEDKISRQELSAYIRVLYKILNR